MTDSHQLEQDSVSPVRLQRDGLASKGPTRYWWFGFSLVATISLALCISIFIFTPGNSRSELVGPLVLNLAFFSLIAGICFFAGRRAHFRALELQQETTILNKLFTKDVATSSEILQIILKGRKLSEEFGMRASQANGTTLALPMDMGEKAADYASALRQKLDSKYCGEHEELPAESSIIYYLDQVAQRCATGEPPVLDELDDALVEYHERLLAGFQTGVQLSFAIGFLGTLTGAVVQTLIAQGSIMGAGFMTGSLLALTTTLVGLISAVFINRMLLNPLQDRCYTLHEGLRRYACVYLLPSQERDVATITRFTDMLDIAFTGLVSKFEAVVQHLVNKTAEQFGELGDMLVIQLDSMTQKIQQEFQDRTTAIEAGYQKLGESVEEDMQRMLNEMRLGFSSMSDQMETTIKEVASVMKRSSEEVADQMTLRVEDLDKKLVQNTVELKQNMENSIALATKVTQEYINNNAIQRRVGQAVEGSLNESIAQPMVMAIESMGDSVQHGMNTMARSAECVDDASKALSHTINMLLTGKNLVTKDLQDALVKVTKLHKHVEEAVEEANVAIQYIQENTANLNLVAQQSRKDPTQLRGPGYPGRS